MVKKLFIFKTFLNHCQYGLTGCLDLQKENPTENINAKFNQSSIITKANNDVFAFGDDKVLRFFETERSINFSTKATGQSLSEEQPSINF